MIFALYELHEWIVILNYSYNVDIVSALYKLVYRPFDLMLPQRALFHIVVKEWSWKKDQTESDGNKEVANQSWREEGNKQKFEEGVCE